MTTALMEIVVVVLVVFFVGAWVRFGLIRSGWLRREPPPATLEPGRSHMRGSAERPRRREGD